MGIFCGGCDEGLDGRISSIKSIRRTVGFKGSGSEDSAMKTEKAGVKPFGPCSVQFTQEGSCKTPET